MKKCYKVPEVEVVEVDCNSLIALSVVDDDDVKLNSAETRESYRSSLWND